MNYDNLTMEEIQEHLDTLEYKVRISEGDPDLTGQYFDELKHLREIYDRMIKDSQGRGIQMMQDIMDKSPETRDNYVEGVPVANSSDPDKRGDKEVPVAVVKEQSPAAATPAINLTINVVSNKEDEDMSKSLDDRASGLAESYGRLGADIRIPINIAADMRKGQAAMKEPEASVDAVDLGKMREQKKKMVAGEDDTDYVKGKKKKKDKDVEKSLERDSPFFRAETETLEKGRMKNYALHGTTEEYNVKPIGKSDSQKKLDTWVDSLLERYGSCIKDLDDLVDDIVQKVGVKCLADNMGDYSKFSRTMAWAIDSIRWKTNAKDKVAKSIETTLMKSGTLLAGRKAPTTAAKASAYAKICGLNAQITMCEAELARYMADPVKGPEYYEKLKCLHEQLAIAVMGSEGLGLKTEDMSRNRPSQGGLDPDYGFKAVFTDKSQSQDLEKGRTKRSGHITGMIDGMKYAMTYWDAEGGLTHGKAQKLVEAKIPSLKSAIKKRLNAKIPHLADASTGFKHVINLGGDENATIQKVPGQGTMSRGGKKSKKSKGNQGKHWGQNKSTSPHHSPKHYVQKG